MKSKLIIMSGIDSAGKSTQISFLTKHFGEKKVKYKVVWSRGGYTNGFEFLKKIIRTCFRNSAPPSGRNEEHDKMFKSPKKARLWYVIAMIDLIRLYAITFRIFAFFGYTIIADRYLWDTYVDFKENLPIIDLEKSILWKIATKTAMKTQFSFLFYVSPEESYKRSVEKKEPFLDSLETRINRINVYNFLIKKKCWNNVIDTEKNDLNKTFNFLRDTINGIQ